MDAVKASIVAQLESAQKASDKAQRALANFDHPYLLSEIDLGIMREAARLVRNRELLPDTAAGHFDRIAGKIERQIEQGRA